MHLVKRVFNNEIEGMILRSTELSDASVEWIAGERSRFYADNGELKAAHPAFISMVA